MVAMTTTRARVTTQTPPLNLQQDVVVIDVDVVVVVKKASCRLSKIPT